ERALGLVAVVRAMGGTVVATGGCFDLLHAGHVATLRAARALGDCLVVCLNSDDSVRRLKGPERPLAPEADRVAVLEALGCVDVVVPFDERTPEAVLRRLRPDVFAKGGDYALTDLPEAALLGTWGGQAGVLPYLQGRSPPRCQKEVARRDSHCRPGAGPPAGNGPGDRRRIRPGGGRRPGRPGGRRPAVRARPGGPPVRRAPGAGGP